IFFFAFILHWVCPRNPGTKLQCALKQVGTNNRYIIATSPLSPHACMHFTVLKCQEILSETGTLGVTSCHFGGFYDLSGSESEYIVTKEFT
ncbi:hypothetical protein ACJX0J_022927, partial [Zea mays]